MASWLNDVRAEVLSYVPTQMGDHLTAAKKELLAAARVVIDEEIRWSDKRWEAAKAKKAERKARDAEAEAEETTKPAKPGK
jgi:hypothetical protein